MFSVAIVDEAHWNESGGRDIFIVDLNGISFPVTIPIVTFVTSLAYGDDVVHVNPGIENRTKLMSSLFEQ
jgi:hypothetical protein